MPWNAIHIGINSNSIDRLIDAVNNVMPGLGINLLIVEVNYNFEYESYPQLRDDNPVSKIQMKNLINACRNNEIRIVPQFQSLGHQSWSKKTHPLLKHFPEFDETPMIPLDNPGIYCRSWCPLNPDVYDVVFTLIDELIEVFDPALQGEELEKAIIGEYLHEAPRRIPQYAEMRDILQSLKTPEQLQHDVEMYFRDVEEYGEDRPFEQWNEVSRKDAFIRGYAVGQWRPEYYTDEQKSVIDIMMGLIRSDRK